MDIFQPSLIKPNLLFQVLLSESSLTEENHISSLEALDEIESDEEVQSEEYLESTASTTVKVKPVNSEMTNLMRMKISCWNFNAKTYRKKLPLELAGKKEHDIFQNCGIEDVLVVNKERTSALSKNLRSILTLAEYALFR